MPAPRAFTGVRLRFLEAQLNGYAQADSEGHAADFAIDVARRYLKRFPVSLSEDKEPTAQELQAVDDDAADEDRPVPVQKEGMSDDEYAKAMTEYEDFQKTTTFKVQQIQRWLKNWSKKGVDDSNSSSSSSGSSTSSGSGRRTGARRDPLREFMVLRLLGPKAGPGRCRAAFHLYGKKHADQIEVLLQQKLRMTRSSGSALGRETSAAGASTSTTNEQATGPIEPNHAEELEVEDGDVIGADSERAKLTRKGEDAQLAMRQEIVRAQFNKLTPAEKEEFVKLSYDEHEARVQDWQERVNAPFPQDPASRQLAIESIPNAAQPILDLIHEATGWNVTIIAGGPEPADQGRLNIMRQVRLFLVTIEECRQRRLNDSAVPSFGNRLPEGSNINHDTITGPIRLPDTPPVPTVPSSRTFTPAMNTTAEPSACGRAPAPARPVLQGTPSVVPSTTGSGETAPPPLSQPRGLHRRSSSVPPSPSKSSPVSSPVRHETESFSPATTNSSPVRGGTRFTYAAKGKGRAAAVVSPTPQSRRSQFEGVVIHQQSPHPQSEDEHMVENSLKEESADSDVEFLGFVKNPVKCTPKKRRSDNSPTCFPGSSKSSHHQQEPTPRVYDVATPVNAPDYVMRILTLLRAVGMDRPLRDVVSQWLRLEAANTYDSPTRLSTQGRPRAVADWIARARSPIWRPVLSSIDKLDDYNGQFVAWLKACSPAWRQSDEDGIEMLRRSGQDWSCMECFGPNGIANFMAALSWWKEAVEHLPYNTAREQQRK
ncbi:SERTA domain-containing protein 3 [Paramarasmius palmivorus]|uniref:SERTA domain-containing protein 3 n=1 Tax=Paramarasmius palmivorus TaxID=297713 RepID=A0AAW0BE93_9AGAR